MRQNVVPHPVSPHHPGPVGSVDRVEPGTERPVSVDLSPQQRELVRRIKAAARLARKLGLGYV